MITNAISQTDGWRSHSGFLSEGGVDFESVHILLGQFISDRHSPNPLPDTNLLQENPTFEWGRGYPLEKVIHSEDELEYLLKHPKLFRQAIAIIEPWEHVGYNPLGERVRASRNVAYLAQKISDCDSVLFPLWSSGAFDLDLIIPIISSGMAVIVEGGDPSVRFEETFNDGNCSLASLHQFAEQLLLSRSPTSAPAIFICLGHQLAAQAHIRLLQKVVQQVDALTIIPRDPQGKTLKALKTACAHIEAIGSSLKVQMKNGHIIARHWRDPEFAVGPNEHKEVGASQLIRYTTPQYEIPNIPPALIVAHEITAHEFEGVIDTSIQYENELNISMFHSDKVNDEAILMANWAYRLLHETIIPHRQILAGSSLSWLMQLPFAVEILCSSSHNGEVITECSATCINYKDYESKTIRRSFTCQFHPELLADLRVIGDREPPSYAELKKDDGARLFARLLYAGMQE
jgi:hypothetical protein